MVSETLKENTIQAAVFDPESFPAFVDPLELVSQSMITGVGLTAEKTAAAVRAGIDCYQETSIMNSAFNPMKAVFLPEECLPDLNNSLDNIQYLTTRKRRMLRLLSQPLLDIASTLTSEKPLVLMLALPEQVPGVRTKFDREFLDLVSLQTGLDVDKANSQVFPFGRAAGIAALNHASAYLNANPTDTVIVGGVDSFLDLYYLANLDTEKRILAENVMDAFAPGEGAGFVSLRLTQSALGEKAAKRVFLHPPGLAIEPGHRYADEEPYRGDGLSQAIQLALEGMNPKSIETLYCTLNGENFGSKEFGVSQLRNKDYFSENMVVHHPAEYFGDLGAAFAPVLTGLAATGLTKAYLNGDVLLACSAEREARGAVRISIE